MTDRLTQSYLWKMTGRLTVMSVEDDWQINTVIPVEDDW